MGEWLGDLAAVDGECGRDGVDGVRSYRESDGVNGRGRRARLRRAGGVRWGWGGHESAGGTEQADGRQAVAGGMVEGLDW